ncbi:type III-B CRISPR module-associated protein Cmr5 [Fusobacterium sp. HC1336]|uniref:type III-B CRISPR module-associated protein Cmr5 n=1 Tax=Fusobacterium sp. HC1336 TaxID=3171169 RepID=UPI003F23F95B
MERRVEKYFPKVLEITREVFEVEIKDGGIPSEYKGYISTFGTMVIQNGILPAIAYYEKKDSNTKEDRVKLIEVIKRFLFQEDEMFKNIKKKNIKLVEIVKDEVKNGNEFDREKLRIIEEKIIDISIALKLSLRTYLKV